MSCKKEEMSHIQGHLDCREDIVILWRLSALESDTMKIGVSQGGDWPVLLSLTEQENALIPHKILSAHEVSKGNTSKMLHFLKGEIESEGFCTAGGNQA